MCLPPQITYTEFQETSLHDHYSATIKINLDSMATNLLLLHILAADTQQYNGKLKAALRAPLVQPAIPIPLAYSTTLKFTCKEEATLSDVLF